MIGFGDDNNSNLCDNLKFEFFGLNFFILVCDISGSLSFIKVVCTIFVKLNIYITIVQNNYMNKMICNIILIQKETSEKIIYV